ncbi:MAG: DUF4410 domain-containing protein [Wenzhouxiangellaceae bacterium]
MNRMVCGGLLVAGTLLLQGCGTTSGLKAVNEAQVMDFSGYDRVVVLDFADNTNKAALKADKRVIYEAKTAAATRTFADLIAAEIRKTGAYAEVLREPTGEPAVMVTGTIIAYKEGNAAARFLVGMGAGSSYFDAEVLFSDLVSSQRLAEVRVDKNSWALGGGLAAGQTVEHFMQGAARKIARELAAARVGAPDARLAQAGGRK